MKPKGHIPQNTSQQYIRVDDEVEILVDKPVPLKMESGQMSKLNSSPHITTFKVENRSKCNKPDLLEYADDYPEKNFKSPHAFHSPAQLTNKKRGSKSKNCVLYDSVEKNIVDIKKGIKVNMPAVSDEISCKDLGAVCDNNFDLFNCVKKKECMMKSVNVEKKEPPTGKKQWKKNQCFSFTETEKTVTNVSKVSMPSKFSKNVLSKTVNKLDPINTVTFYNTQNDMLVANEADTPPFTPNMEITCCDASDSSSCTKPEIVYLKTKPCPPVANAKPKPAAQRNQQKLAKSKLFQSNRVGKIKQALLPRPNVLEVTRKKKQFAQREINALFENLAEISWSGDKDFTSLLKEKDALRHRMPPAKTGALSKTGSIKTQKSQKVTKTVREKSREKPKKIPLKPVSVVKAKPKSALSAFVKKKLQKSAKIALNKKTPNLQCRKVLKKKVTKPVVSSKLSSSQNKSKISCGLKSLTKKKKTFHIAPKSVVQNHIAPKSAAKKTENEKNDNVNSNSKSVNKPTDVVLSSGNPLSEIDVWGNVLKNPSNNFLSALPTQQELRVTLEPLERTGLWPPDCDLLENVPEVVEAYTRCSLQQRMLRVFTGIDQRHISSVLRDIPDSKGSSANNTKASRKRKYDEESLRSSVRQSECAFKYKEIFVKKHENYIQIILVPKTSKQNSLTIEGMKELKEAFLSARKDSNCKAVLLNSSGSYFCSGIDLGQLHGSNKKHIAEEMAITIRDLVLTLALLPKPVIAAVNGYAIGLGVTLLTYCDVVLSSDKATFCIPATKLGYIPEGGALLTLPQVVGSTVAIEMLLQGRRLTAEQALKYGLVSEVLWPTKLMEEAMPRVLSLVKQPLHVMEATKTMVRYHLWEKLGVQLNQEWRMLPTQWLSSICQQNIKHHLQTGWQMD